MKSINHIYIENNIKKIHDFFRSDNPLDSKLEDIGDALISISSYELDLVMINFFSRFHD